MRIRSFGVSHPGLVRPRNEDALLMREADGLWLVADGMGGHRHGDWAARAVAASVAGVVLRRDFHQDVAAVEWALQHANVEVHAEASRRGTTIGSTAVCLLVGDKLFAVTWAGDSRAYILQGAGLDQLTRDHTPVQELVEQGCILPSEARTHPKRHILTHAIGVDPEVQMVTDIGALGAENRFLLCSDGLTEVVEDVEIGAALAQREPRVVCEDLLQLALARGAPDNVTIAIIVVSAD